MNHGPVTFNSAADRMRRHRQRRREGLRCLTIELRETEIDVLVGKRLLRERDRGEPSAVIQALYEFPDSNLKT